MNLSNIKILTENGYNYIKNIKINDKIYSHNGNINIIKNVLKKEINKTIYNIKTLGNDDINCDENQHWLTIKRKWRENVNFDNSEWINTKNLEIGNLILIPKLKLLEQTIYNIELLNYSDELKNVYQEYDLFLNQIKGKNINITKFCKENKLNYRKIINWKCNENEKPKICNKIINLNINKNTSWFLGIYLAEGWTDNSKGRKTITISLGDEPDLIEKTINIIKNEFNIQPYIRKYEKQKGCQISFTHQLLSEMFIKDFSNGEKTFSHTKKIPEWISNIGKENVIEFLRGYFDGDGCFFEKERNCNFTVSSVSEILIDEIKILLMKLDILPNKISNFRKKQEFICGRKVNTKNKYVLQVSGKQLEKFINIFNINSINFYKYKRYNRFFENNFYWAIPVTKIEKEFYNGNNYNLDIENDNSYLVNGGLSTNNNIKLKNI
jgi:intein/homing endonuclease